MSDLLAAYREDIEAVVRELRPIFADSPEPDHRALTIAAVLVIAQCAADGDALAGFWCHHNVWPDSARRIWGLLVGDEERARASFPSGAWGASAWRLVDRTHLPGRTAVDRVILALSQVRSGHHFKDTIAALNASIVVVAGELAVLGSPACIQVATEIVVAQLAGRPPVVELPALRSAEFERVQAALDRARERKEPFLVALCAVDKVRQQAVDVLASPLTSPGAQP